ncbi:MAG: hypothetical protein ACO3A4_12465 [Silvanigrellaceae bacterium]
MGIRQRLVGLILVAPSFFIGTTDVFAQSKDEAKPAAKDSKEAKDDKAKSAAKSAPAATQNNCPAPTTEVENSTRLRELASPFTGKKFKIKLDKGGNNIGLPAPANETAPNSGECFYALAENQKDVVAEIVFQKVQKNNKGVTVWVFSPARRSEAGKSTLNMNAIKASDAGTGGISGSAAAVDGEVIVGENALALPAFVLIQNAQHQTANVRSGVPLNIPVSGYGIQLEAFVPKLKLGTWINGLGLRVNYSSWTADKLSFKKPVSNEVQDATATGSGMQIDVVFRYPVGLKFLSRAGVFISPVASQTEILQVAAGASSPKNTQTLTRSGLLLGADAEMLPANNFFLSGRITMSLKETVTIKDESDPGEKLSGSGTATRLHLTGMAGVRLPLTSSNRFMFEGLVGNTYRTDKYSEDVAYSGQGQQKDIMTYFLAGFGYIL